jgi:protein-S-isoprenylcysteine O-methyltransferase Ste14
MDLHDWFLSGLWIAYSVDQAWHARRSPAPALIAKDSLYRLTLLATIIGLSFTLTAIGDQWIMGAHLVPQRPVWFWFGFGLTAGALAMAAWARRRLGAFWSNRIEIKQGHRLIQDGPYRLIRHPIYLGLIVAAAGSAIADGDVGAVVGFIMIAGSFILKLRREERFIASAFGAEWTAWRIRTWALVPYLY